MNLSLTAPAAYATRSVLVLNKMPSYRVKLKSPKTDTILNKTIFSIIRTVVC